MTKEEEALRTAIVQKQWLLAREASARRHLKIAEDTVVTRTTKTPPALTAVMTEEQSHHEIMRQEAEAEAIRTAEPGLLIPGQGVFVGQYTLKDSDGKSLGKTFNVFAAPQDLTDASDKEDATFTYAEAIERVADLKSWHGFDGANYTNDAELYQALKDGSYKSGWIIPPRELLDGTDINGDKDAQKDNLYAHKDEGSLKDTFCLGEYINSDWYWSSTLDRQNPTKTGVWNVCFDGGKEDSNPEGYMSCRPVRLVPVPTQH